MAERPRRVLLLAGRLGAQSDGRPIQALLERLASRSIEARVLCVSKDGANDTRIVEIPGFGSRWHRAFAVRRLRLEDEKARPELLHVIQTAMAPVGLAIAERWSLPYIQTVDEFLDPHERLRVSRPWCKRLVAVSADLRTDLSANFGVPSSLLSVIEPGITVPEPAPEPTAGPARSERLPVIGTAGPLVPASGFATFLNAARRVVDAGVDAEFVIAGQGEAEYDLRRRASRLRIAERVTFVAQPVLGLRFWNVLNVYCQTSLVATVAHTLTLALASGVPSIASDIEGIRQLVAHDRTGILIPPDDSSALAGTILGLLRDSARANRLAAGARLTIRRQFDPDEEASKLAELYRAIPLAGETRRGRFHFAH